MKVTCCISGAVAFIVATFAAVAEEPDVPEIKLVPKSCVKVVLPAHLSAEDTIITVCRDENEQIVVQTDGPGATTTVAAPGMNSVTAETEINDGLIQQVVEIDGDLTLEGKSGQSVNLVHTRDKPSSEKRRTIILRQFRAGENDVLIISE